jgi:hypothetical protein
MFAGVIGGSGPTVGASAQATWLGAPAPCSVCVLGNLSSQNGQIFADLGSVLVGGSLSVGPNGMVTSPTGIVGVVGTSTIAVGATVFPSPPVHVSSVTDPYAVTPALPPGPPAPPLGSTVSRPSGPVCSPGTYDDITACQTLRSGIYVLTGLSRFSGGPMPLDATSGVLLYFTCSTVSRGATISAACAAGQAGGSLIVAGSITGTITALPDPIYRGLAIAYDRRNTADLGLVGGPGLTVDGNVYAPSATFVNSGTGPLTVAGTLVVGSADLNGVPSTVRVNGERAYADLAPMLVHLTQ